MDVAKFPQAATPLVAASEHKRQRKRSSQLLSNIRQQMEFYFSDANFQKDRFLKQLVDQSEDGYVDVELFLKFNKIRALTTDVVMITKALSKSTPLELSTDLKKVRRKEKFKPPADVDSRTVYVECLPAHANHDWVRQVFTSCGKVLYVSLPKFKTTGDIKGFAFVEFESAESAAKACTTMNNPPVSAPETPGIFPRASKQEIALHKQLQAFGHGNRKRRASESTLDDKERTEENNNTRKRKRTKSFSVAMEKDDDCDGDGVNLSKDITDSSEVSNDDKVVQNKNNRLSKGGTETSVIKDEDCSDFQKKSQLEKVSTSDMASPKKKQKTKKTVDDEKVTNDGGVEKLDASSSARCKAERKRKAMSRESEQVIDEDVVKLEFQCEKKRKVKLESNEHDRVTMEDSEKRGTIFVKQQLTSGEQGMSRLIQSNQTKLDDDVEKKKRKKKNKKKDKDGKSGIPELRVLSKSDWLLCRSEYLALQKKNMSCLKETLKQLMQCKLSSPAAHGRATAVAQKIIESESAEAVHVTKPSKIAFTSGVIVKLVTDCPTTRQEIKDKYRDVGDIAYVDVIEGATVAHIRCGDSATAQKVSSTNLPGFQTMLLSGVDEEEYWKKLAADRERKLESKTKTKRRGRDKMLRHADNCQENAEKKKHIVFD